jgi:hypothetical protein
MLTSVWQFGRVVINSVLITVFAVQSNLLAQAHVVSPAELQQAVAAATRARQHNLQAVAGFLSSPKAEKALRSAHMDSRRVNDAVSSLSDEELARLASRAEKAQIDVAAGRLSDRDLLLVLLGLAALILIIVAVR